MTGMELATRGAENSSTAGMEISERVPEMPWMMRIEEHAAWEILSELRMSLRAVVALNRFRVSNLLTLKEGQVFESASRDTDDVVLLAGQSQLGWSEFEVMEQRMAVRLTRLG